MSARHPAEAAFLQELQDAIAGAEPTSFQAHALMHEPVRIELPHEPASAPAIEQHAVEVDAAQRTPLLVHLVRQGGWTRVLVFVATRYASEHVADKLRRAGIEAAGLHGELSQGARTRLLADFKLGRLPVLVATDIAARGLHIDWLDVVVNYDLPRSAVDHVHRIGRTARAGAAGLTLRPLSDTVRALLDWLPAELARRVRVTRDLAEASKAKPPLTTDATFERLCRIDPESASKIS